MIFGIITVFLVHQQYWTWASAFGLLAIEEMIGEIASSLDDEIKKEIRARRL